MKMRTAGMLAAVCSTAFSTNAAAQQLVADTVVVRTIQLQFLSNSDAAKLVSPYVPAMPQYGVFTAGSSVHAITVRAPGRTLRVIDSLVKANDRPPVTVVLRLQVIAASDSAIHDAAIGEIDAELRNLFRFNGYRLLSQNSIMVNEDSPFITTMRGPHGDQLTISGGLDAMRRDGNKSVQLQVTVSHNAHQAEMVAGAMQTGTMHQELLRTGLSIPLGQTVVVGSAMTVGPTPAIILAVRPELAPRP